MDVDLVRHTSRGGSGGGWQQFGGEWRTRAVLFAYAHEGPRRTRQGAHEPERFVAVWRPDGVARRPFRRIIARE